MEIQIYAPLATAFAGLLVGFFAEPVKNCINSKCKRRQLRRSLYKEMANMYVSLKDIELFRGGITIQEIITQISQPENKAEFNTTEYGKRINTHQTLLHSLKFISTRCYEHTKNEILLFYELDEAVDIDAIYISLFALLHTENIENINLDSVFDKISELTKIIENFAETKEVSTDLFFNPCKHKIIKKTLMSFMSSITVQKKLTIN